jgi:glycosyltransferase involved in cell wall biosynthesis
MNLSVIIPVYNGGKYLRACLEHLSRSMFSGYECIVVDDGSTDDSVETARSFSAKVLSTGGRRGPAHARNLGAKAAAGDVLFFIDSDVCVGFDTLARVAAHFADDPELAALMGSYDDSPKCKDFLSQYKNLMHCFVHQNGQQQASTFWSGCGAIRKHIFLEHSGFDESYGRPAIEDIELGFRLFRAEQKLLLDPDVQVKHLKAWSFFNLVKTDVFDRGIPWTELIMRDRRLPNDLNLQISQRISVALMFLLVGTAAVGAFYLGASLIAPLLALFFLLLIRYEVEGASFRAKATRGTIVLGVAIVALSFWSDKLLLVPPVLLAYLLLFLSHRYAPSKRRITSIVCGVYLAGTILFVLAFLPRSPWVWCLLALFSGLIVLNSHFYLFLAAKRGRLFAIAAVPFHLLFHFYNGISFLAGMARFYLRGAQVIEKPVDTRPAQQ